jgi:VanZ family protein
VRPWRFALLYMATIFVISSFEVEVPGLHRFPLRDKGIHFVEYAVLGWLCAAASFRSWPSAAAWRTVGFAIFVSALWGVSDEIHQAFVPGRFSELNDVVADFFGGTAGAVSAYFFSNRTVS